MLDGSRSLNDLTEAVIGAAIEVHRNLGPGLPEQAYEAALAQELSARSIPFVRQAVAAVHYKGVQISECRLDLLIHGVLVIELKAVEALTKLHEAQLNTYLRVTGCHLGLLINFNVLRLTLGIRRVANRLPPSDLPPSATSASSAFSNPSDPPQ